MNPLKKYALILSTVAITAAGVSTGIHDGRLYDRIQYNEYTIAGLKHHNLTGVPRCVDVKIGQEIHRLSSENTRLIDDMWVLDYPL